MTHPDPVMQEVLDTWMARFLRGGIAIGDLFETIGRIRSWQDWGPEWMKTAAQHEALAQQAWDEGRLVSAVDGFGAASRYYHLAYFLSVDDVDLHNRGLEKMVECHDRVLDRQRPAVEKLAIPFGGSELAALLTLPPGVDRPPVVIVLPGLDSTKETRHAGRAAYLRRRMGVVSFDGPGQGEISRRMPLRHDYEVAITALFDHLETRDDLDAARIGVNGSSLGGYYAARAAAFEPRIRAVVANCGPYDWAACWDRLPSVTRAAFRHYSWSASDEEARAKAGALTLERAAERITSPLFVIHGMKDPLIPWQHGKRLADEARGPTELHLIEEGGHSVQNLPHLVHPQSLDWLAARLGE
jgi:2,6-dihydroxypseudooxynicotine hydrolase